MVVLGRVAISGLAVAGVVLASGDPLTFLFFASYMAVGAFLAIRRPDNIIGWLLIGLAFGFIATTTVPGVDVAALQRGDASLGDALIAWLGGWAGVGTFIGFLALTIVIPNGRLPQRDGRRISILLLAVGLVALALTAFAPVIPINAVDGAETTSVRNPFAILPDLPIWSRALVQDGLFTLVLVLLGIGVVRMFMRYRRASGVERLQLRWIAAAVMFVIVGVGIGLGSSVVFGAQIGGAAWVVVLVAYPTIPLAVGVAVMRYRLLEIDRIISRTVSYAVVTAILAAVFVAVILLLQNGLAGVTGNQGIPVAISTLAVFALFQPVLRRVRRSVDRRFDRAGYDGERTAVEFAERLRWETDMERVSDALRTTVASAVAPDDLAIWLRPGRQNR